MNNKLSEKIIYKYKIDVCISIIIGILVARYVSLHIEKYSAIPFYLESVNLYVLNSIFTFWLIAVSAMWSFFQSLCCIRIAFNIELELLNLLKKSGALFLLFFLTVFMDNIFRFLFDI